jgi:hypothetical protein
MHNRFSPSPDPTPVQPVFIDPNLGSDASANGQDPELVSLLVRFAAVALVAALGLILAIRMIGLNKVKPAAKAGATESNLLEPLVSTPSYVSSATRNAIGSAAPSYPQSVQLRSVHQNHSAAASPQGTYYGGTFLRMEDGRFNEAVRQWVGQLPPRVELSGPVDTLPTELPVPQRIPGPAEAPISVSQ